MKRLPILLALFGAILLLGASAGTAQAGCETDNSEIDQYSEQIPTGSGCDEPTNKNGGSGNSDSSSGGKGSAGDGKRASGGKGSSGGKGAGPGSDDPEAPAEGGDPSTIDVAGESAADSSGLLGLPGILVLVALAAAGGSYWWFRQREASAS